MTRVRVECMIAVGVQPKLSLEIEEGMMCTREEQLFLLKEVSYLTV